MVEIYWAQLSWSLDLRMTLAPLLQKPIGEEPDKMPEGVKTLSFLGGIVSILFAERLWSKDKRLYS